MKEGFRWQICGENGRLLFGRRYNDDIVFMRYVDMSEEEKGFVVAMYCFVNSIPTDDEKNDKIKEITDYLNYKEEEEKDDFCG